MVTRPKSLQGRAEYAFLRHNNAELARAPSAINFLTQLLGLEATGAGVIKKNQIVILDMNDVEDEVVELVSSVTARMLFKLLRRADPRNRFPIHLLLEEAHRYIAATPSRYAVDATKGFERIAKEGRKYGMFILLASQRPSELSKTVLSQCSNFVVHRIQNPDDLSQRVSGQPAADFVCFLEEGPAAMSQRIPRMRFRSSARSSIAGRCTRDALGRPSNPRP